jgi:prepilin-type N-terminal cleavage/methylation domain-containing protein
MLRINKQGFTLIELMVVIVIIGVLASLAIPRFTDASIKAKVAEAPRVIASFESAYLAGVAEGNVGKANLVFDPANVDSKWFTYQFVGGIAGAGTLPADGDGLVASANAGMAKLSGQTLVASYITATDFFTHAYGGSIEKYVPNFKKN